MAMSQSSKDNLFTWLTNVAQAQDKPVNPTMLLQVVDIIGDDILTFKSDALIVVDIAVQESAFKQAEYDLKKARVDVLEAEGFS